MVKTPANTNRFYRNVAIVAALLLAASFVSIYAFAAIYLFLLWRPFNGYKYDELFLKQEPRFFLRRALLLTILISVLFAMLLVDLHHLRVVDAVTHITWFFSPLSSLPGVSEEVRMVLWKSVLAKICIIPLAVACVVIFGTSHQAYKANDLDNSFRLVGGLGLIFIMHRKTLLTIGVIGFLLTLFADRPVGLSSPQNTIEVMKGVPFLSFVVFEFAFIVGACFFTLHRVVFWNELPYTPPQPKHDLETGK